jgi:hypothetical protein
MQLGEFFRSWPVPFLSRDKAQFVSRGHDVRRADVPDASHDAHLDANGAWAAALKSFLSSCSFGQKTTRSPLMPEGSITYAGFPTGQSVGQVSNTSMPCPSGCMPGTGSQ